MANSFELILDTTGPDISIHAPKYSVISSITEFEIIGSENLSPEQDFYFMDAAGKRHEVIFFHEGNSFSGQVNFSNFAEGIATFYGQVKDDVFNLSPVFSLSIKVAAGNNVDVELEDRKREITINEFIREINNQIDSRLMELVEVNRKIQTKDQKRNIDMQELIRKMGVESDG